MQHSTYNHKYFKFLIFFTPHSNWDIDIKHQLRLKNCISTSCTPCDLRSVQILAASRSSAETTRFCTCNGCEQWVIFYLRFLGKVSTTNAAFLADTGSVTIWGTWEEWVWRRACLFPGSASSPEWPCPGSWETQGTRIIVNIMSCQYQYNIYWIVFLSPKRIQKGYTKSLDTVCVASPGWITVRSAELGGRRPTAWQCHQ